jgi:hypothetical protein
MASLGAKDISRSMIRKGVLWVIELTPAGRTSALSPKATEARPSRGAEPEAMTETRRG